MIRFPSDKYRQVIPRWRGFRLTAELGELGPLTRKMRRSRPAIPAPASIPSKAHDRNLAAWQIEKNEPNAVELILSSIVAGRRRDAIDAVQFVTRDGSTAVTPLKDLALGLVVSSNEQIRIEERPDVQQHRRFVHAEPRDAIGWADLALAYAVAGQSPKAERALKVAVSLAPGNRHVLRSAACFYSRYDDPEKANDLLNRFPATPSDPWLMSAEIATASMAGRGSRCAKRARDQIARGEISDFDATEVAAAVATLELENGNQSRAKKLFRASMVMPTENVVAQAEWVIQQRHLAVNVPAEALETPLAFEAIGRNAFVQGDWNACCGAVTSWMKDQPFLLQPPLVGSYVACDLLRSPEKTLEFTQSGLRSNPASAMLYNNQAVALAQLGRLDEADQSLLRAFALKRVNIDEDIVLEATEGLVAFRRGNAGAGRALYERAIASAVTAGRLRLAKRAYLALIEEEVLYRPYLARSGLSALQPLIRETNDLPWKSVVSHVRGRVELLANAIDPHFVTANHGSGDPFAALKEAFGGLLAAPH